MGLFSPSGASPIVGTTTIAGKTTPAIQNLSMPTAGTEYSFTIPAGAVAAEFFSRECGKLQFSFVATQSGTTYRTVFPGAEYQIDLLDAGNAAITVYIQSTKDNDILEIVTWS